MSGQRGSLLDLSPAPCDPHAACTRERHCGALACPAVQASLLLNPARRDARDEGHAACTPERNCAAMACPAVQATARRAAARAGSWSPLAWDGAGWSLGGRPLPSGATVDLQEVSGAFDEYGSYHRALQAGTPVQFYLLEERPDRPLLRLLVGGHKFAACYEPWMRFRWPQGPQGGGR